MEVAMTGHGEHDRGLSSWGDRSIFLDNGKPPKQDLQWWSNYFTQCLNPASQIKESARSGSMRRLFSDLGIDVSVGEGGDNIQMPLLLESPIATDRMIPLLEMSGHQVPVGTINDIDRVPLSMLALFHTLNNHKDVNLCDIYNKLNPDIQIKPSDMDSLIKSIATGGYVAMGLLVAHLKSTNETLYDEYHKAVGELLKPDQIGERQFDITLPILYDSDVPSGVITSPTLKKERQTPVGQVLPAEYAGHPDQSLADFVMTYYDKWEAQAQQAYRADPNTFSYQHVTFTEPDTGEEIKAFYYADSNASVDKVVLKLGGYWYEVDASVPDAMNRFDHPEKDDPNNLFKRQYAGRPSDPYDQTFVKDSTRVALGFVIPTKSN